MSDQRVQMSAACRAVADGADGVWVTWCGERLRLGPVTDAFLDRGGPVVIVDRGRFYVTDLFVKDARSMAVYLPGHGKTKREHRSMEDRGGKPADFERWRRDSDMPRGARGFKVQPRAVRAVVLERHRRVTP